MPFSKNYTPAEHEDHIYKMWEESGAFKPSEDPTKKPYAIIMPPPNATGTLHLGHAQRATTEDALIRYHRMKGDAALWLPGTDHAAIATNAKVERIVNEEGKTKEELGRDEFIRRVKEYVANSQDTIRRQFRATGASCDWSREKYTMDEDVSEVVNDVFIKMYYDRLIYRGKRIVNWCPHCQSTLADDEVEYKEEKTNFYYFNYGPVVIGTARPETKFADKVIVVNPDDSRFEKLEGLWDGTKTIKVEWIDGPIEARIIADKIVDKDFGTGAMTITPAHSFEDFALAQKYKLEMPKIIDEQGNLTAVAGEFAGQNARMAREAIVKKLDAKGLLHHIDENYIHNLSICYRCGTGIEPLISEQWFINVDQPAVEWKGEKKSLKQIAIEVVKNGEIKIVPERFEKIYFHWMENLHDWCISRQIWWGHQIPVWYKDDKKILCVSKIKPEEDGWTQDPDTLDTWFSAGMWTFSTLGWSAKLDAENQSADFKRFHPTDVLETAHDIIFFWVARMILMTTYATKQIPFKTVLLSGLVRDKQGRKMSKSLGNGIDPLEMIVKYGADALRLSLIVGVTPGNDAKLSEEKIAGYRNFTNKLWNIGRYVEMVLEKERGGSLIEASRVIRSENFNTDQMGLFERWILSRLSTVIKETTEDIENFHLSSAADRVFKFVWSEFADWYLECIKGKSLNNTEQKILLTVLEQSLRLLHPFMPFVTEVLWNNIGGVGQLITADWAGVIDNFENIEAERQMDDYQEMVQEIRSLKNTAGQSTQKDSRIQLRGYPDNLLGEFFGGDYRQASEYPNKLLSGLAGVAIIDFLEDEEFDYGLQYATRVGEINFPIDDVDVQPLLIRLQKESAQLQKFITSTTARLASADFTANAPEELIFQTKTMLSDAQKKFAVMQEQLNRLN